MVDVLRHMLDEHSVSALSEGRSMNNLLITLPIVVSQIASVVS